MSLDSFMNKAYSVVNLLSLALGNETAAKRQIILSSDNEKFTIPVTPRSYEIKTAQNNETIDILDFGEAMLFGNAKLKRLSFSGFSRIRNMIIRLSWEMLKIRLNAWNYSQSGKKLKSR